MPSLQEIKIRIKSIKATRKITKAMEMVAASKMRRAQMQALKGRPYLLKLEEMIASLISSQKSHLEHPFLLQKNPLKKAGYIFLTSNRGLCGAFNSNIIRSMLEILKQKNTTEELVISVGRKGRQAMERIQKSVLADFENLSDRPSFLDTVGISKVVMDGYMNNDLQEIWLVYNHFYSTMTQKPLVKKLLPIDFHAEIAPPEKIEYIFDIDRKILLTELLNRYIQTSVYQVILESLASEQSARMMAMRQASTNAQDIVSNLTLHYNKARQAKITTQILEIVAAT